MLGLIERKIQRGTTASTTSGIDVTINKVNMDKCLLFCSSGRASNDTIVFVNDKTIKITTSVNGNVNWQVYEVGGN